MSRTRIEDLSTDKNELFDLSEEQMLIGALWGGSGEVTVGESKYTYDCSSTGGEPDAPMCDTDKCTVPD